MSDATQPKALELVCLSTASILHAKRRGQERGRWWVLVLLFHLKPKLLHNRYVSVHL